ncbi:MAG: NAD(P)-dependent alcohol dehydrogenase [Chloroflexota bacterium]|nr:NAD(P)-dependent alcohol dehydrogenase [Chloroflexota bacterium]
MKAIVQHEFGAPAEVLQLAEVEKPTAGDGEVLVRVRASSANPYDWRFIRGEPYFMRLGVSGFRSPKHPTPGGDLAGVVEEVGTGVDTFAVGDEVYGFRHGAFAEYISVPHSRLAKKPSNLTFGEAAAVPLAAATAIQGLRDVGGVKAGDKVLIIGASGGIGTFAVQMAKEFGAEVSGVCSTPNVELVRSLGADHVIDYRTDDFTRGDDRYDVIFQLGGTDTPGALRRVLSGKGTLVQCTGDGNHWIGPVWNMLKAVATNPFVSQSLKFVMTNENTATFDTIRELIEGGKLRVIIDSTFPFEEAGEALKLIEEGSPKGKVVITGP